MIRQLSFPEDRIKTLETILSYDKEFVSVAGQDHVRMLMCEQMGLELGRKLFEFNKVTIKEDGDRLVFHAKIEVIVPYGPPK